AEGVLMLHQRQVVALKQSIIAIPKGRRTGITFAVMLRRTLVAAASKEAGGDNVYYIGDTKEKGLEAIGYCARFSRTIAKAQGEVSGIEEFLFEDQDPETGKTRHITAYRIRFASGFQACALSSRPANIRGLQGHVVIDEAAFHQNVQDVLDAASALLIWGGQITVISSHNGKKNPFAQFCRDIEAGRYGDDAIVVTVTFDTAVANGLYERVCWMKGEAPTAEGKAKWYAKIRNAYGIRKAAMREELDAIPRDGNGVCLPGVWIDQAMSLSASRVLRLALDDDFVRRPPAAREAWAKDWIERYLDPMLKQLDPHTRHVFSHDYARHRDFSSWGGHAITPTMRRQCLLSIEMHKVPYAQQKQITWHAIRGLPKRCGGAMDATGSGESLAEETADEFGHDHVHQVTLNRGWYGTWMPKLIQGFEDGMIDLPQDANMDQDLRAIEEIDGIPMINKLRRADLKDPDLQRHGDSAVMLALGWYASLHLSYPMEFMSGGPRESSSSNFGDFVNG
ncbi:MAG: hypothetical protein U1A81_14980, partial [Hydrogenophaga sp.]|nr:hypothetical protein [Hydrogenophaga sp.]